MDEKGSNVHLSDQGLDELSPGEPDAFVVPDLSEVIGEIQDDEALSGDGWVQVEAGGRGYWINLAVARAIEARQ
jgi:hypothetical protein